VWYIIYKKLHAEAKMRYAVAVEKGFNAPPTAEQRQASLKKSFTSPAAIKAEVKPHAPKIRHSPVIKTPR
jgi:hypothetical protein